MKSPEANQVLDCPGAVIIIPAFNEADVIRKVIIQIRANCNIPIIVVDDASSDATVDEAERAGATVASLPVQLGAWGATQTGVRYALRRGYDLVITMDADGQHDAGSLAALVRPVLAGEADVSIGSCTGRGSRLRRIAWVLMKRTSGLALEDITSGYRAYNRRAIRALASWRATLLDYQDIGVLLLLKSRGLHIVGVPVTMHSRKNGKSRIFSSWMQVGYYMCHTLLLGLSKRTRGQQPAAALQASR